MHATLRKNGVRVCEWETRRECYFYFLILFVHGCCFVSVYICKWPMVLDNINNKCRLSSLLLLERVAAAAAASLFTYFIYSSSWAGSGTAKCDPSTGNLLKISFLTKGTSEPRRARAVPAAAPQMARLGALLLHAEIVCERDQRFFSPCLPGTQINLRAQELFRSNEAEVGSSDDLGNGHRYF